MEPDERQDSNFKLADVQPEPETATEPTTDVVKAESTTELTPELTTDVAKAPKMKKQQEILNVLNKERN